MRHEFAGLTLLLLALAVPLHGQIPAAEAGAAEAPNVAEELRRLNATLAEIQKLLAQQLETENLDLLLKRMEFASARVGQLESQIRNAEAGRRSLDDERQRLEARLENLAAQVESGTMEVEERELEAFSAQIGAELKRFKDRIRDADLEIAELKSRLAEREKELRDWQDLADRRLGGS